ncbi:hypothetical protein ABPG72_009182 [Tetrahymena utriculariae]
MSDQSKLQEKFDKRTQLEEELKSLEKNIYDLETQYLEETFNSGNIIRGWENYFTSTKQKSIGATQKKVRINTNDRIFSLSSTTSPAHSKIEENIDKNTDGSHGTYSGFKRQKKKSKIGKNAYDNESPKHDLVDSSQISDDFYDQVEDSVNNEMPSKRTKKIKKKKTKS